MVAVGGVVSIVKFTVAGVASVLPAASRARTRNECTPSPRPVAGYGLVAVTKAALSTLIYNVLFASEDEKAKSAEFTIELLAGPEVMVVSGATESTVQVADAGVASTLPAPSRARTS